MANQTAVSQKIYPTPSKSDLRRFWAKVRKTRHCWIWIGSKNGDGYGHMRFGSRTDGSRQLILVMHVSFFIAYGRWPKPLACHTCDNPPCIRPEHLFEGEHKDNRQDCVVKGRAGSSSGGGPIKLDARRAVAIRREYAKGLVSMRVLGHQYGISQVMIHKIISGKNWRNAA